MADVYGTTQTFDDLRDKAKAYLDALITAMAAVSPKIEYAYAYHNIAALKLNGATVGIEGGVGEFVGMNVVSSAGVLINYDLILQIRVHTAYTGRVANEQTIYRLLDSVKNYFMTHIDMADDYDIVGVESFEAPVEFSDSQTIGGQINFKVQTLDQHTQA